VEKISDGVSIVNIMPTPLAYLEAEPLEEMQGRNLLRLLNREQRLDNSIVYADLRNERVEARSRSLKLDHRLNFPKAELYDLVKDPEEKPDLFVGERSSTFQEEKRISPPSIGLIPIYTFLKRFINPSIESKVEFSKDLEERLRALGYVQ